jgi:hypothetical protein
VVAKVSARAGVHRPDQGEARRVAHRDPGAGDEDRSILEWLAQGLQDTAVEFGELIQEKNAVVRESDLPRPREAVSSSDHPCVGDGVVRGAERWLCYQRGILSKEPCDTIDPCHIEGLIEGEGRKNSREGVSQHALSRSWRTD